jgi:hypothetical protein
MSEAMLHERFGIITRHPRVDLASEPHLLTISDKVTRS